MLEFLLVTEMAALWVLLCLLVSSVEADDFDAVSWYDDFASFNSSIWIQSTDLEHCPNCFIARPDHLDYNASLVSGIDGLNIQLNQRPCNVTPSVCCNNTAGDPPCASWASGHLRSASFQAYGSYYIHARVGHAPGSVPGPAGLPPNNTFSCFSASYVADPVHNEITTCWRSDNSTYRRLIHYSYWYNATMNFFEMPLTFDTSQEFHTYGMVWRPDGIDFSIDGSVMHSVQGIPGPPSPTNPQPTIPWEPGQIVLILRPLSEVYSGDSEFSVAWANYSSTYE